MSRMINARKNIFSGIVIQIITSLFGFINRTVFIYCLGADFLGLSGLFTNILSVLSLAELGIGDAITFALYRPLSKNDTHKISILMSFYRKTYIVIGIIIFIIGICLIPFLKYIVNFDTKIDINYYYIYILFLLNSVISYLFFSYRISLLNAAQKNYMLLPYNIFFTISLYISQIIILIIFKNYYLYLLIPICFEIIKNYTISKRIKKEFSKIDFNIKDRLIDSEKKSLIKNIYALSLTKISSIIYSSSDNIIISIFISTTLVGYYTNYTMIIGIVTMCTNIIFNSLKASIGDLNVMVNTEHKKEVFDRILFVNRWIYYFFSICLFELLNMFISLWVSTNYTLNDNVVLVIVFTFLIPGLNYTVSIFKDACGLFWETRYRTLLTAIINIISSIIFVHFLGIIGVFIGTILAYLLTIYTLDPVILYKKVFKMSSKEYYITLLKSFIIYLIVFLIVHCLCKYFMDITLLNLIIRLAICCLVTNILFWLIYHKCKEYTFYKDKVLENWILKNK